MIQINTNMDTNAGSGASTPGHSRNLSSSKVSRPNRPRTSTKGPLDAEDVTLNDPLSPPGRVPSRQSSPRSSPRKGRSPARPSQQQAAGTSSAPVTSKDFSYLLRPEIYHQVSSLATPAPFRNSAKQPSPLTPIPDLVAHGHFRAAAIASVQALTSSPVSASEAAAHPPVDPTDHERIFSLLYTRLACLCLIDNVPLAAQEAKALEDLTSAFYLDPLTGAHLVPWELRVLGVRLQTLGFGDPRRAVMSYYDLAREARMEVAKAVKAHDHTASELWKNRLAELGVKVAGALVEMDDLVGAAHHLATLADHGDSQLAMSKALLWMLLGDVEAARRAVKDREAGDYSEKVVMALADMADGEYESAIGKWRELESALSEKELKDEMVGVNLAVCLLYVGKLQEGREVLEELVEAGKSSHTLLFDLSTMYELCTDRNKALKVKLAERLADAEPSSQGWEKTNADFKL